MFEVEVIKPFFDVKEKKFRKTRQVFICDKGRFAELTKQGYIRSHVRTKAERKQAAKESRERLKELSKNRYSKKHWETKNVKHKVSQNRLSLYENELVKSFLSDLYLRKVDNEKLSRRVKEYYGKEYGMDDSVYNQKKYVVDYIRHTQTNYDRLLTEAGQFYKEEKPQIHKALKIEIYELIKNSYPNLSAECEAFKKKDEKYLYKKKH